MTQSRRRTTREGNSDNLFSLTRQDSEFVASTATTVGEKISEFFNSILSQYFGNEEPRDVSPVAIASIPTTNNAIIDQYITEVSTVCVDTLNGLVATNQVNGLRQDLIKTEVLKKVVVLLKEDITRCEANLDQERIKLESVLSTAKRIRLAHSRYCNTAHIEDKYKPLMYCPVCLNHKQGSEFYELNCTHVICKSCLGSIPLGTHHTKRKCSECREFFDCGKEFIKTTNTGGEDIYSEKSVVLVPLRINSPVYVPSYNYDLD